MELTGTFDKKQQESLGSSNKLKFSMSDLPEDWHDRIFGKKEDKGNMRVTSEKQDSHTVIEK